MSFLVNPSRFGSGVTPILDTYGSATLAFSTRKLRTAYAGNCLRVREDGGDTETNIGFDGSGILDTAAIATHCGANNGYVVTWFDQSGNTNDFTQSVTTKQPLIYNGSSVPTATNGNPGVDFDGTNDDLYSSSDHFSAGNATRAFLAVVETTDTIGHVFGESSSEGNIYIETFGCGIALSANKLVGKASSNSANVQLESTTSVNDGATHCSLTLLKDADSENFLDGTSEDTDGTNNLDMYTAYTVQSLGGGKGSLTTGGGTFFDGLICEAICWESDQSSNASGINTNVIAAWDI